MTTLTPDQLSAYNNQYNSALGDYFKSGNYMLNYGNNTASDPATRFLNDPGTQLALANSNAAVGNQYAARGLGSSGALAAGLNQNMYNNYQNWLGTQNQNFTNYQNQLANIAQQGISVNGANLAAQNANQAASLFSNNNMNAYSQLANVANSTGQSLANLFNQQGINLAGLTSNTAAAQANNIFNANNIAYQLAGAQLASNAQTMSSYIGGQGYKAAAAQI